MKAFINSYRFNNIEKLHYKPIKNRLCLKDTIETFHALMFDVFYNHLA